MTEPTSSAGHAELGPEEAEAWNILAPALHAADAAPELLLGIRRALEVSPGLELPLEICEKILALLPLEDRTRLAATDTPLRGILERLVPQALNTSAHTAPLQRSLDRTTPRALPGGRCGPCGAVSAAVLGRARQPVGKSALPGIAAAGHGVPSGTEVRARAVGAGTGAAGGR
ncbi:hypothetical protein [Streptomyces sp. NPDC057910]|uniref:hypothetical protein n=1 Tax=Streptomyces sp. NPDC057910 TaxID=3346278 RepID=UPI0036EDE084